MTQRASPQQITNAFNLKSQVTRCLKCHQGVPSDEIIMIMDPRTTTHVVAWHGCFDCLVRADAQVSAPAVPLKAIVQLLMRAKRCITEPTSAAAIDEVCNDIEAVYLQSG
jgi:hypothetical protein